MFNCERCGACCRKIGTVYWAKDMALSNGICKYLNQKTNLCTIYENRPIFCNVEAFYKKYYKDEMSVEDFYKINKVECTKIRQSI
ncbi:YkgJ family cysteine cluster protein [Megamonas sp.]